MMIVNVEEDAVLKSYLVHLAKQVRERDPVGITQSNRGAWHSNIFRQGELSLIASRLWEVICGRYFMDRGWFVAIDGLEHSVARHAHHGCDLSTATMLAGRAMVEFFEPSGRRWTVPMVEGRTYAWPSALEHQVEKSSLSSVSVVANWKRARERSLEHLPPNLWTAR